MCSLHLSGYPSAVRRHRLARAGAGDVARAWPVSYPPHVSSHRVGRPTGQDRAGQGRAGTPDGVPYLAARSVSAAAAAVTADVGVSRWAVGGGR